MLLAVLWVIKSHVSDPGISCLLLGSMKLAGSLVSLQVGWNLRPIAVLDNAKGIAMFVLFYFVSLTTWQAFRIRDCVVLKWTKEAHSAFLIYPNWTGIARLQFRLFFFLSINSNSATLEFQQSRQGGCGKWGDGGKRKRPNALILLPCFTYVLLCNCFFSWKNIHNQCPLQKFM